jgi:pimeloyl-ACP methyl ester carboxylesterase
VRYRSRVPFVQLAGSPMLPGVAPIEVYVRDVEREAAAAEPLLVLHGGWGYEFYPFDAQIAALDDRRIVAPDRTGYGKSPRLAALPPRFHHAAAAEHIATLDALGIERCAIWGHSDGAVIAAIMALRWPERITAIVLEALHLERSKPRSREFFEMMEHNPEGFGSRVAERLAADHGEDYWRTVLGAGGRAWLDIAAHPDDDFYEHRLGDIAVPVLVLHGADDPRTEPGELDRVVRELPDAAIHMIAGAGHSPHSERRASAEATREGARFLRAGTDGRSA